MRRCAHQRSGSRVLAGVALALALALLPSPVRGQDDGNQPQPVPVVPPPEPIGGNSPPPPVPVIPGVNQPGGAPPQGNVGAAPLNPGLPPGLTNPGLTNPAITPGFTGPGTGAIPPPNTGTGAAGGTGGPGGLGGLGGTGTFPGGAIPGGAFPGGAFPGGAIPGGAIPGGGLPGGSVGGGPSVFRVVEERVLGPIGALKERGRSMFASRTLGRTTMACATCHRVDDLRPVARAYPRFNPFLRDVATLEQAQNACLVRFMRGSPLPYWSRNAVALSIWLVGE